MRTPPIQAPAEPGNSGLRLNQFPQALCRTETKGLTRNAEDSPQRDFRSRSSERRRGLILSGWSKNTTEYGAAAGALSSTSRTVNRNFGLGSTRSTRRSLSEQTSTTHLSSTMGPMLLAGASSDL